jgi:hypothetical protein
MFNALESMKAYNGNVLQEKLKGEKMNISYEKKYLQEQVMRSLRNFHTGLTSATILNDALRDIEILFKKRLSDLCLARVKSAQLVAEKYENYAALVTLIDYEYKLIARAGNYDKLWNYRKEGYIKKSEALKMSELIAYAECLVFESNVILFRKGAALNAGEKEKYRELYRELKQLLKSKEKSFLLEEMCLIGLYQCTTSGDKVKESYTYSKMAVELYLKNDWQLADRPGRFYAVSVGLVNRCILLHKYDEAAHWLEKTKRSLEHLHGSASQEIFGEMMTIIYVQTFRVSIARADFAKGLEQVKEFEQFEKSLATPPRPNLIISMRVYIARIYFGGKEYAKALQKLNQLINWKQSELQEDVVQFAYLLRLLVYYEMKKYELLENQLVAVTRFFANKWSENKKGMAICEILHSLLRAKNKAAEATLLLQFKKRFQELTGKETIQHEYNDFIRWADEKWLS